MKCLVGTLGGKIFLYVLETGSQRRVDTIREDLILYPMGVLALFKSNFSITVEIEIDRLEYEEVISKIPVEFLL